MMQQSMYDKAWTTLFPTATARLTKIAEDGTRFVHYTSADAGISILRNNCMWLRNSSLMNDFSEVQHGWKCLLASYDDEFLGARFKSTLEEIHVGLSISLEKELYSRALDFFGETYLISISEHGDRVEDRFGRLSMWRAYANANGVAFVFRNTPFINPSEALNAFTSPVNYADEAKFRVDFEKIVNGIEANVDMFRKIDTMWLYSTLLKFLEYSVLSTKYIGFQEEKEWRVIYSPTLLHRAGKLDDRQRSRIPTEVISLKGVPQRIYKIPFVNYPQENLVGATISELVEKIIIGPTSYPYAIKQAFIEELISQGVTDAHERVVLSQIPIRQ